MLKETYIVHKSNTLHMKVLPIERVLKELNDIVSDGILGSETLSPCQDFSLVQGSLLHWETERETKWERSIAVVESLPIERVRCGVSRRCGRGRQESVNGVSEVV